MIHRGAANLKVDSGTYGKMKSPRPVWGLLSTFFSPVQENERQLLFGEFVEKQLQNS
jgi:hypothetical protein